MSLLLNKGFSFGAFEIACMHRIAVIPGDGIGPEVIAAGVEVLTTVSKKCGIELAFSYFPWGANHYLETGEILSSTFIEDLQGYSAVYLGAIGDPRVSAGILERGIVGVLRWDLDLYVNLRPLKLYHERYSPLKTLSRSGFDILVVRENTEDLYTGISGFIKKETPDEIALAVAHYTRKGIERIIRYAFTQAQSRRKKLTLCDKANAIPAHDLWRRVYLAIAKEYPDVETEMIYVDACAMALVRRPHDFDVIVTTNLFGDILTDLGAELCGGIGTAPSANLHPGKFALFEPIHGSAPKYAGKNTANPIGAILAGSMMLDYLGETQAALIIESAVKKTIVSGKLPTLAANTGIKSSEITELVLACM